MEQRSDTARGGAQGSEGGAERWGGRVRAGRGELVPARFAWHDPESGERLLVDFEGSEGFFRELETLGFERQPQELAEEQDEPRELRPRREAPIQPLRRPPEEARRPA